MTDVERRLREEVALLQEEVRWLKDLLAPPGFLPAVFKLSAHEERTLKALLSRKEWTREALYESIYLYSNEPNIPDMRMIDTVICKLRRKIKPWGIEIETLYGQGFRIAPAMRAYAAKIIDEEHEKDRAAPRAGCAARGCEDGWIQI